MHACAQSSVAVMFTTGTSKGCENTNPVALDVADSVMFGKKQLQAAAASSGKLHYAYVGYDYTKTVAAAADNFTVAIVWSVANTPVAGDWALLGDLTTVSRSWCC